MARRVRRRNSARFHPAVRAFVNLTRKEFGDYDVDHLRIKFGREDSEIRIYVGDTTWGQVFNTGDPGDLLDKLGETLKDEGAWYDLLDSANMVIYLDGAGGEETLHGFSGGRGGGFPNSVLLGAAALAAYLVVKR